ncbi:MAG: tetratricopeptide repeat protein [Bacteroidetes bacterium]|nr:MAG: tetratricopeptide repeat protein [Bacteroidota bacterium]
MENKKLFEEGIALLKSGEYQKALVILDKLIVDSPNNASYYSERGVIYFHLKKKQEALSDMNMAVELEPLKSYRYASRAYILGHYGKTELAITDYEKAIELDPDDAIAHNNLGLLQEQLGYQQNAKTNFYKADDLIAKNPEMGRANLNIEGETIKARNIQEEIDAENKNKTLFSELKQITSKEGFNSFIRFVKSGFKKT